MSRRTVLVVATALLSVTACSAPAAPPAATTPATTGPVPVSTLDEPQHHSPVPIAWHEESRTFFVGTVDDGSVYRGSIDDPTVPVFLQGEPGRMATGMDITGGKIVVAGGLQGDIRVYDLQTRAQVGTFSTGAGGFLRNLLVTDAGDVWATDTVRPVLWHLTQEQVATGSGTPSSIPLAPEIPHIRTPDNVEGIVALIVTRLVVVKFADGTLYRIDLDPAVPNGRTITPITGAAVSLGSGMILDGTRLVVADENGVSVVELNADASSATLVTRLRDPSFHDATAVARVGDRYLVVNAGWNDPPPYTISSVPVVA
jgi:hypothetical protein